MIWLDWLPLWLALGFLVCLFIVEKLRSSGTPTTIALPTDLKPEDIDWLRRHFELCEGRGITMALPVVVGPPPKGPGARSLQLVVPVPHNPRNDYLCNCDDCLPRDTHTIVCRCWECRNVHDVAF